MLLAVVVAFELAVLGVVANSVVQFIRASSALPRRVLAVLSSLALLRSIYYFRAGGWSGSRQPPTESSSTGTTLPPTSPRLMPALPR